MLVSEFTAVPLAALANVAQFSRDVRPPLLVPTFLEVLLGELDDCIDVLQASLVIL